MKKVVFAAILLCASLVWTRNAHAALVSEVIDYRDGDTDLEGYIVYDDASENKRPGVIVVHEWKGLNNYAKKRADQLAELGYVAFAIDIYGKGVRPKTGEAAGAEAGKYKGDRMLTRQRAAAALEIFKQHPLVDPSRTAAIGYCFGGMVVLEMARAGDDLNGAVSFHGGLSASLPAKPGDIKAKLLVLHGSDDPHVPSTEVAAFQEEMHAAGADLTFVGYPGAVHGFTNPDNGSDAKSGVAYNEEADSASWRKMKEFFVEVFGKAA